MPTQTTNEKPAVIDSSVVAGREGEQRARELAIKQIERKRRLRMRAASCAAASIVLVIIWAISEYNNAGGWPTDGFSQSSSIPHVWNIWIIYPLLGLGLILGIDAWNTYGRKPIAESEIQREMDRLTGAH
jgi:protein-S-isoprenylcysteine O-methyltransferase Ste14